MALPPRVWGSGVLAQSPLRRVQSGIVVGIVPGDDSFRTELYWAPESTATAGTPSSSNAVLLATLPPAVRSYTHLLPLTTARHYYQSRHVRPDVGPSTFTGWANAYAAPLPMDQPAPWSVPSQSEVLNRQFTGSATILRSTSAPSSTQILAAEQAWASTSTGTGTVWGSWFSVQQASGVTPGVGDTLIGQEVDALNFSTGTVANLIAHKARAEDSTVGTITNAYAYWGEVANPFGPTFGTAHVFYANGGLVQPSSVYYAFRSDQLGSTATLAGAVIQYSFRAEGNDIASFQGGVQLGATVVKSAALASYTLKHHIDCIALVSASSGAKTVNLPAPLAGQLYRIKKTDTGTNAITIVPDTTTHLIDGSSQTSISASLASIDIQSDGTKWWIL